MYNGSITANAVTPSVNMKNRIINGGMVIDQRNAGASVTAGTSNPYTLDRWVSISSQDSKYTVQQNAGSVTPPVGFTNYLGITSSSAYTVGAAEQFLVRQQIEGYNIADLAWGTANAKTVTLSFWVRSSLTGTFGGGLYNSNGTRSYPFSYTISAANTWEYKSVTIAGDTSGTWQTTNSTGVSVGFGLGVGSSFSGTAGTWAGTYYSSATGATSVVGTNGATFYITGVQLEVGSTATSFDYRPYGTELALCQRYYEKSYDQGTVAGTATATGANFSTMLQGNTTTSSIGSFIFYKATKRATPTMSLWDIAGNSAKANRDNFGVSDQSNVAAFTQNTGDSSTQVYVDSGNAASGMKVHWTSSAEL
jgi:hypothetical protein